MGIIDRMITIPTDNGDLVLHECRHCGTMVETAATPCPVCGSQEIATYLI